jgi:transcriptional antiterminator NusG
MQDYNDTTPEMELPEEPAEEIQPSTGELSAPVEPLPSTTVPAPANGEDLPEIEGEKPLSEIIASVEAEEPGDTRAWYVIHCYSGYENKVRHNLEQRIETMGMKDKVFDIVVPTQEEIEVREGKRRTVERHIFPGYVLVNMVLTEDSWFVVRNTPGVTGFVGMGTLPTPLRSEEVNQILKRMEADAPTVTVTFKEGERVRIVDGPFNDFRGVVSEIDVERTKVRVMVLFFGRETPVELDFLQVEKA